MAMADGGEDGPGGRQLAVPDSPQVPGGGQQEGQQEPGGRQLAVLDGEGPVPDGQLAVPDGQVAVRDGQLAVQMPNHFTIGTTKAFERQNAYAYTRQQIGLETIYV